MKKDTSHTLKRAQRFPVILIGEGLLVGAVSGLIVMLYRIALTFAGQWLNKILEYINGHPIRILGWFAVLLLLAVLVGWSGEMGAYDLGQWYTAGRGRSAGKAQPELETGPPGQICRRISLSAGRSFPRKRRPVHPAGSHGRTGSFPFF